MQGPVCQLCTTPLSKLILREPALRTENTTRLISYKLLATNSARVAKPSWTSSQFATDLATTPCPICVDQPQPVARIIPMARARNPADPLRISLFPPQVPALIAVPRRCVPAAYVNVIHDVERALDRELGSSSSSGPKADFTGTGPSGLRETRACCCKRESGGGPPTAGMVISNALRLRAEFPVSRFNHYLAAGDNFRQLGLGLPGEHLPTGNVKGR